MLYLDFSCTQRLMTPISPDIKDSLENRAYAVFSSIFLLVDASVHLFAATYKSFGWAVSQISYKNPSDHYKEAYPHLIKALRCTSMIFFGSLVGFIRPNAFESKKLQEYLGWKGSLTNNSKIIENKELKEQLQSKNEEIKRLKLQIDSLTRSITSNTVQDDPQSLVNDTVATMDLVSDETGKSISSYEDTISLNSGDEFLDAEDSDDLIERLTKELQVAKEEIAGLKSQIDSLNKILSPTISQHNSLQKSLVSAKMASSDNTENMSTLNETLEKELQLKNEEMERLTAQIDLLNKTLLEEQPSPIKSLFVSLGNRSLYVQILLIKNCFEKSPLSGTVFFDCLSHSTKQKIDQMFITNFQKKFCEFCKSEDLNKNPNKNDPIAILNTLLKNESYSWGETPIVTAINSMFKFL